MLPEIWHHLPCERIVDPRTFFVSNLTSSVKTGLIAVQMGSCFSLEQAKASPSNSRPKAGRERWIVCNLIGQYCLVCRQDEIRDVFPAKFCTD